MVAYINRRWWGLVLALAVLGVDAVSKVWALSASASGVLPWWLLPRDYGYGEIGLVLHWNRGMSFSLLDGVAYGPWILGAVAVVAIAWFTHWLGEYVGFLHRGGLGLVIGGALGNLADRVVHGAVVDFILVNPWGLFPYTFNLADTAITVGVVLLLLDSWLRRA